MTHVKEGVKLAIESALLMSMDAENIHVHVSICTAMFEFLFG